MSDDVRRHAMKMAKEALEKRLQDINMGKASFEVYEQYRNSILLQRDQLRMILDEFSRRSKERVWLRNQSQGDLVRS